MKDGQPVALVTGANGFIGGHVSRALMREGWIVRRAVRRSCGTGDEVVVGPLGPATNWQTVLIDVDAVVHLAARVHHKNDEQAVEAYRIANVEGTLHLARSAIDAGVARFVFLSTVLVHGRSNDGRGPFSESDVLTPRGLYAASKAGAEAGLSALANNDMQITVIRPPLVYGSGAKGNFALLVKVVKRGIPLPFAAINNHRAFVSVDNLTSFILRRLSVPGGSFDTFLVADQEQVSTPEFVTRLANAAKVKPRLFPFPMVALGALLRAAGKHDTHDSLVGSLQLTCSKAASIGWTPPVSLDEGLDRALNTVAL